MVSQNDMRTAVAPDQIDDLVTVLDLLRRGIARTRPEIARQAGLGRTVVTQRVGQLVELGLLEEGNLGPSTGGRAPRELGFNADAGCLLVAELGATSISIGLSDLNGRLLEQAGEDSDIADGPDRILGRVERLFDKCLKSRSPSAPPVWGVGIGVPGPVEFAAGRPIVPPIMPGWDGYPVRERFVARYDVPVWVDNDVNLMALGELRGGMAIGVQDFVFVKIGTGIGAGLISGGRLHRGAQGCAGDVGHVSGAEDSSVVCRCGNLGCLEALAAGWALAREGRDAAQSGRSRYLAELLAQGREIGARDVARGAQHGDQVSVELLTRSGRLIGEMLATLVNFYNPSLILIGGGVAAANDLLLAAVRETVYRRSLPLATRDLRIVRSPLDDRAGLLGAAFMVADELFARQRLAAWADSGSPVGRPDIVDLLPRGVGAKAL